jgi:hypothetical protein
VRPTAALTRISESGFSDYNGRMLKPVPIVSPEHMIAANSKAVEDREKFGSPDVSVSVVSALHDKLPPQEVLAVMHRLLAHNLALLLARTRSPSPTPVKLIP